MPVYDGNVPKFVETITYTSHGFVHGDFIRKTTDGWEKSIAIPGRAAGTAGMVNTVIDANTFIIVYAGRVRREVGTGGVVDYIPGNTYYVSNDEEGNITDTPFEDIKIPVFIALDEYGTGYVLAQGDLGDKNVITDVRGYLCGGYTGSVSAVIEGLKFSDESVISVTDSLSEARSSLAGFSSQGAGYVSGGNNGTTTTKTTDSMNFSNEALVTLSARKYAYSHSGGVASPTDGYCLGGYNSSNNNAASVEKRNFNSQFAYYVSDQLSAAKRVPAGNLNYSTFGYIAGGYTTAAVSTIEGVTYADDSNTVSTASLSAARYAGQGAYTATKGYCLGGYTTTDSNIVDGVTFATDTAFTGSNTLTSTQRTMRGNVQTEEYAYLMSGVVGGTTYSTSIQRFKFSDDTSSIITATVSTGRNAGAGISPRVFLT